MRDQFKQLYSTFYWIIHYIQQLCKHKIHGLFPPPLVCHPPNLSLFSRSLAMTNQGGGGQLQFSVTNLERYLINTNMYCFQVNQKNYGINSVSILNRYHTIPYNLFFGSCTTRLSWSLSSSSSFSDEKISCGCNILSYGRGSQPIFGKKQIIFF